MTIQAEAVLTELKQEKLIIKADSQILNAICNCGQFYEYAHVLHRRPLEKNEYLAKGGVMHDMLAHYYRAKMNGSYIGRENIVVSQALELGRVAAATNKLDSQKFEDVDIPTFKRYILKYQYDGWDIQFVEQPFSVVLYDSADLMIIWEGIVDLGIKEVKGEEAVVDHKTESRKNYPFNLDNQFEGYAFAFKRKVIVNKVGFQETLPDEEKFRRYHMTYSEALIEEWKKDAIYKFREAISWHKTEIFPRNRTSCNMFFSGCDFKLVCKEEPEVREYKLRTYFFVDKPWDPYTRDSE